MANVRMMKYVLSKQEAPGVKWRPRANEVVLKSDRNYRGRFIGRVFESGGRQFRPPEDYVRLERALGKTGVGAADPKTEDLSGVISAIVDRKRSHDRVVEAPESESRIRDEAPTQPPLF